MIVQTGVAVAWTDAELRAIADGEVAAKQRGVTPSGLSGAERAAWRAGYARGWNGLGGSGKVDLQEHRKAKPAWQAGWKAGYAVCKAAARGYTRKVHEAMVGAAAEFDGADQSVWTTAQRDAYDDGVACGHAGLIPIPTHRYRGRLRELSPLWNLGWAVGLELLEQDYYEKAARIDRERAAAKAAQEEQARAQESEPVQDGAAETAPAPGQERTRPSSAAERQRAYRARRHMVSIDLSAATHELLRQVARREGKSNEQVLQAVLEAALKVPDLTALMSAVQAESRLRRRARGK